MKIQEGEIMKNKLSAFYLLFLASTMLFGCTQPSSNNEQETPSNKDGVVTYVSFDKLDKNNNFYDEVTGTPLYNIGNVTQSKDKAAKFDGESSLELVNFPLTGNAPHTMMCYVKTDTTQITVTTNNVIAGWGVEKDFGETVLKAHYGKFTAFTYNKSVYADFPSDSDTNFHQLALSYDGENMYLYLDYALKGTIRLRGNMNVVSSSLYIGGFRNNKEGWAGEIDELYVFSRCLEKKEMKEYLEKTKTIDTKAPTNEEPQKTEIGNYDPKTAEVVPGAWNEYIYYTSETTLNFKIYFPEGYSKDKTYPFQLFLHGAMGNGHDVDTIINVHQECTTVKRAIKEYKDTIVMVPVCIASSNWTIITTSETGYPLRTIASINYQKPNPSLKAVMKVIDEIEEGLNVDKGRMYLSGVSAGAFASYYLLYQNPTRWAGTIICCGRGSLDMAPVIKNNNIWIFHGDQDNIVDPNAATEMYNALKEAGAGDNVKLTMIEGHDHGIASSYLPYEENLITWLYAQKIS